MKHHSFHELATRISHLSTRDKNSRITVTFGGQDAYTNGKRINLPALPSGTFLTPNQFSTWLGYCLHESQGHLRHTDFTAYNLAVRSSRDPIFEWVLNVLEDIRIENADISLYPGDRKFLDAWHRHSESKTPIEKFQNPDANGLFYKSAYEYRNYQVPIQGQTTPEIQNALKQLPNCNSTKEIILLAETITKLLKQKEQSPNEDPEQQEQQEQQSEQQFSEDQAQTPNCDNPESNSSPAPDEPDLSPSDYKRNDPGPGNNPDQDQEGEGELTNDPDQTTPHPDPDGQTDNSSNNSGHGRQRTDNNSNLPSPEESQGSEPEPLSSEELETLEQSAHEWQKLTEVKNLLNDLIKKIHRDDEKVPTDNSLCLPPADLSFDRIFIESEEDLDQYLAIRAELTGQILALKKMFRIHLQSQSQKSWLRGLEEGELDKERLWLVASGQKAVFKARKSRTLINTAVELMIDLSSSMDQTLTQSTAIVLAEALSAIPEIKLGILGFKSNHNGLWNNEYRYNSSVGRTQGMDILIFKHFDEPYTKCRAKLGAIETQSSTPLGDAYGKALEFILPRQEPRRIIFLITDGKPSFRKSNPKHSDYPLMDRVHAKAKTLGIETLGLGIGEEQTVGFLSSRVDKCLWLETMETLPQTLLSILKGVVR